MQKETGMRQSLAVFCVALSVLCTNGCWEGSECGDIDERINRLLAAPLEIATRVEKVKESTPKKIAEMSDPDIIVAINGYPLLKRDFEAYTGMYRPLVERMAARNYQTTEMAFADFRAQFLTQFIKSRLLIDHAISQNIMTAEELTKRTRAQMEENAAKSKTTVSDIVAKAGQNAKFIVYQTAERILIKELVNQRIPPAFVVDMTFVSNVQAQVSLDNAATSHTNALRRQMLEGWRNDIKSKHINFIDLANQHKDQGDFEIEDDGEWESFTRDEIEDEDFRNIVFSSSVGDVLPLQEDEDGIDLVMVDEIIPEIRNKGDVAPEQRVLKRIRMEKLPLIVRQSNDDMLIDLKKQAQIQAIETFTEKLATNGVNSVVYPHGENLF